jgi:hypothetical protein
VEDITRIDPQARPRLRNHLKSARVGQSLATGRHSLRTRKQLWLSTIPESSSISVRMRPFWAATTSNQSGYLWCVKLWFSSLSSRSVSARSELYLLGWWSCLGCFRRVEGSFASHTGQVHSNSWNAWSEFSPLDCLSQMPPMATTLCLPVHKHSLLP